MTMMEVAVAVRAQIQYSDVTGQFSLANNFTKISQQFHPANTLRSFKQVEKVAGSRSATKN